MAQSSEAAPSGSSRPSATAGVKRPEDWSRDDVQGELRKYARAEEPVVDPLVDLLIDERQGILVQFLNESGRLMARFEQRRQVAIAALASFMDQPAVADLQAPRDRVINLPVDLLDDDGNPIKDGDSSSGSDDDDDDGMSSSGSSSSDDEEIDPSADAPRVPFLDNSKLTEQLETLMVEAKAFSTVCAKVQEYLTLSVDKLDSEDTDVMEIQAKLVEEFGEAREVSSDRYDFYDTYLDVRLKLEKNVQRYPDVQAYRELMVARDQSAWQEVQRSWQLLISSLATLNTVVTQNIRYVIAPDVHVHEATESSLFM